MKWFKHMSESWNDERLAGLVGTGGKDGLALYGAYWRTLEIVAAQMAKGDTTCSVRYTVTRWSLLMSLRGSHVSHYLGQLASHGLLIVERLGSEIRVTIPNLLKYRDEYSAKSRHSLDNVTPYTEGEGDTEKDINTTPLAKAIPERTYESESTEIPDGLPALTYAKGLLETCFIPLLPATQRAAAAAIEAFARQHGIRMSHAVKRLIDLARSELEAGGKVDSFWFQDRKWIKPKPVEQSRSPAVRLMPQPGKQAQSEAWTDEQTAEFWRSQRDRGVHVDKSYLALIERVDARNAAADVKVH